MLETTSGDGRTTRWDAHKAQRREDVLDAAVAAIEQDGPGVGVRRIAEEAGLPRSVVYRHFADRADLDERVRQRVVDALMTELAPTLRPDGTPEEAIRRAVDAYLGWIERHPRLHAFLGAGSGRPGPDSSRAVSGTKSVIAATVADLFTRLVRASGADTLLAGPLASGLVGLVDASVNRWLGDREGGLSAGELADYLTRSAWLVLDGNLRALGVELDPRTPVGDLLEG
ncbi:TetR/AcrR family transcriptional regulator [Saccharopolyspora sp. HNM0983]|uniref:TetR/AcrR family transcriptional regulator n=1 Tax=Saccharopolyspora montiporae TaxID=2781240 RepID=A0A929G2L0_9PSEU|nr:TetR/AcrR family transcriptional regulator [Saccharopolyspora sp. HNM0983]MBE9375908.1 TetR/AcrR family transcriptional regulator [Saccharopolyspora sp. HNM0983]